MIKNKLFHLLGFITCMLLGQVLAAQNATIYLYKNLGEIRLTELIEKTQEAHGIAFFYHKDSLPDVVIHFQEDSLPIVEALAKNLAKYHIEVSTDNDGNVYLLKKSIQPKFPQSIYTTTSHKQTEVIYESNPDYLITKNEFITDTLVIGNKNAAKKRGKLSFTGVIRDAQNGNPVIGATLYIDELKTGAATSANGSFELKIPRGEYSLTVSSIDKQTHKYNLYLVSDGSADLFLEPKLVNLNEVVISTQKHNKVQSTQMGVERLTAREMKEIPVVLGERDVLKVAQLLPGVQKAGEGSSGFNVRGSPADQNLFYLDDIPIYNVDHLVGFFSAIYPQAISEFSIYKSNIPVQYGGRLSSIFDIKSKKGSKEKFGMRGGISPVSSGILFETPLVKEKGSILIGGRSTYSNWLLRRVKDPDLRESEAYFGDMLVSADYNLGKAGQIEALGYYSHDKMKYSSRIDHKYTNQGVSLKWKYSFREKHNMESSLVYSKYNYDATNQELSYDSYRHRYYIEHLQWRYGITLRPHEHHTITAGIDNTLYHQSLGIHNQLEAGIPVSTTNLGKEQALESAIFVGDEWEIIPQLSLYGGLRYTIYNYLGPRDVYEYSSNDYLEENITGSRNYRKSEIIKTYQNPDLRTAIKLMPHPQFSIKGSYNQLQQNLFMLSNTLSLSPIDKWKLADYHIKPLRGDQFSSGLYFNTAFQHWEFSVEGFMKKVSNFVDYRDGAKLLVSEIPEVDILQGNLEVQGLEFMVKKNYGRLSGWLNYTYTQTEVFIKSDNPLKQVNNSKPFPTNYDKPHSVNLVGNFRFNKRVSLSGNMTYSTGRPYTSPISVYFVHGQAVINYSDRNAMRIPDYFRVDMSLNIEGNLRKKKFAHSSWMFSVYNLTGRKNAYSVYFAEEEATIRGYKLSIFGTAIYTVTYVFKLGNYND